MDGFEASGAKMGRVMSANMGEVAVKRVGEASQDDFGNASGFAIGTAFANTGQMGHLVEPDHEEPHRVVVVGNCDGDVAEMVGGCRRAFAETAHAVVAETLDTTIVSMCDAVVDNILEEAVGWVSEAVDDEVSDTAAVWAIG